MHTGLLGASIYMNILCVTSLFDVDCTEEPAAKDNPTIEKNLTSYTYNTYDMQV